MSIALALLPKCPLCLGAWLGAVGISGVAVAPRLVEALLPLLALLVAVHVRGAWRRAARSGRWAQFLLETAGGMVLLAGVASSTEAARYGGVVLLLLGTAASLVAHPGTPSAEGRDGQVESRTESHPVPPAPEGA
ncbi:MAG: hypothetical protein DWQ36_03115 [Acidobacteria bacterium]|nr:MAG: hypothetical protein DWQ30_02290 [Acidobacteriota bacterium]REK11110.1 MAG: hypothetical protein DWQ36_03115 [Acidobacteriota bacterium]